MSLGGLIPIIIRFDRSNGAIPIDAKTSGKHYLEDLEFEEGDARQAKLAQHAKAMRERVTDILE